MRSTPFEQGKDQADLKVRRYENNVKGEKVAVKMEKDARSRAQTQQQEQRMGEKAASQKERRAEAGEVEVGTEDIFNQPSLTLCFDNEQTAIKPRHTSAA